MALNIDTQDLENYPGVTKRVTIDLDSIVPAGYYGDEQYILSASTTAFSNNVSRTAIQSLYITEFKAGWCKSSGFTGNAGKFTVTPTQKDLKIKIDNTVSGTDGSGYYTISLSTSATPIAGDTIARDLESKIRALGNSLNTADQGFALAYKNAKVEFKDGKFWIISGSISSSFSGEYRSSVDVTSAPPNDVAAELGFNLPVSSEILDSITVKEAALGSNYTADTDTLTLSAVIGASAGDCLMITDGTNTDYFTALSGTSGTTIKVATESANGYMGITEDYDATTGAKVQLLREQDPENSPKSYYNNIDSLVRFGVRTMMSQIDYSS